MCVLFHDSNWLHSYISVYFIFSIAHARLLDFDSTITFSPSFIVQHFTAYITVCILIYFPVSAVYTIEVFLKNLY